MVVTVIPRIVGGGPAAKVFPPEDAPLPNGIVPIVPLYDVGFKRIKHLLPVD